MEEQVRKLEQDASSDEGESEEGEDDFGLYQPPQTQAKGFLEENGDVDWEKSLKEVKRRAVLVDRP